MARWGGASEQKRDRRALETAVGLGPAATSPPGPPRGRSRRLGIAAASHDRRCAVDDHELSALLCEEVGDRKTGLTRADHGDLDAGWPGPVMSSLRSRR